MDSPVSVPQPHHNDCPRHSLVVCAALVENPINLGGLCRTAEGFRLESLVLPDLAVTESWAFRKLAASAHRWQPLTACAPDQLIPWIQAQRVAQATVLALTADPQAQPLTCFAFPQRSVLVLGRELTGIPPAVLAHCQEKLTIPQFGQVESLNVQTAAAIAIYEYVRQWS